MKEGTYMYISKLQYHRLKTRDLASEALCADGRNWNLIG